MKRVFTTNCSYGNNNPSRPHIQNNIGVYGLGVMGRNLALNIASKGHSVAVFNRNETKTNELIVQSSREGIRSVYGYYDIKEFMSSLQRPRKVIVMVKAGDAVDDVIRTLAPYLDPNDIIIDGGNEWYELTEQRQNWLDGNYKAHLIGMGVSGGEHGARYGPSLMPGGNAEAYKEIETFVSSFAAQTSRGVCVAHIGSGGAGNYVKMVHNGIEYGIMQVIAEAYHILRSLYGLTNNEIAQFFENCNKGLDSYLLDITCKILRTKDDVSGGRADLIDFIADTPKMNGTGTWTVQDAFKTLVAVPSISSAVDARIIGAAKDIRIKLGGTESDMNCDVKCSLKDLRTTIIATMRMCYLQGFQLIDQKNKEKQWGIDLSLVARVWMGGCIIRSNILNEFDDDIAFDATHVLYGALIDIPALSRVVASAVVNQIPIPTISATLQYLLGYSQTKSSANIIQAQRDFFGAHGYERTDMSGIHHTQWDHS